MLNMCGAMDAGRPEQLAPAVEDRGGTSYGEGREQVAPAAEDPGKELSAGKSRGDTLGYGGDACHTRGHRSYAERPATALQASRPATRSREEPQNPQESFGGRAVRTRAPLERLFSSGIVLITGGGDI